MNIRDYPDLPGQVAVRLRYMLSARAASQRFAPELSYGRHLGPPGARTRSAAVAVLIFPQAGQWMLPLTLRPPHLSTHAGQVSFPGGACEAGETAEMTAQRELYEELGVGADTIRILGRLQEIYVFVSDFLVTPIVMAADERPSWRGDPTEVAEVIEVPLCDLTNPANYGDHVLNYRVGAVASDQGQQIKFRAPHIVCGNHRVWGATTVMLGEFIAVLNKLHPLPPVEDPC
jgi:8-oxo-dGTP pyrophosphatase MutT (NUDIX family)